MKIALFLISILMIPYISLAAVAEYANENDLELERDKPAAEAIVFAPLINLAKKIQTWWNALLDWVSLARLRLTACRINDFAVTKVHIDLPRSPDCP